MAQQGGVITTAQALEAGLSGDDIQRLLRSGQWVALRKGHYALAEHLDDLDQHGVARDPGQVLWAEKQRQDWLLGYQLGMSRVIWAELWGDRRRSTMERIAREYALSCARFSTSIDDLAHLIVHRAA